MWNAGWALVLNPAFLTLIPISNEIDEEGKFGFYHLSHTHSIKDGSGKHIQVYIIPSS